MRSLGDLRSAPFVVLAAALCVAAPVWQRAAAEERTPWIAVASEGQVAQQNADGSESPVRAGATLAPEKPIRTGADGRLVLAHGNDRVTVSANSAFSIPRDADPATSPSILQSLGTLLFKVEHTPGRRFEIQAPYLAAVVKGTVFTVTVSDKGGSVHVAEGAVEVTALLSHAVALLHPGQTALVSSSGQMSIVGVKGDTRSENHAPGADGQKDAAIADTASVLSNSDDGTGQITQTLGDVHLDVSSLTQGLVKPADDRLVDGVTATPTTTSATGSGGTSAMPGLPAPTPGSPGPVATAGGPVATSGNPNPNGGVAYAGSNPVAQAAGAPGPNNGAARSH